MWIKTQNGSLWNTDTWASIEIKVEEADLQTFDEPAKQECSVLGNPTVYQGRVIPLAEHIAPAKGEKLMAAIFDAFKQGVAALDVRSVV